MEERLFASTRGRILELLWRDHLTVDELARALELTDNAVRAHLVTLERDGLIRQDGLRRGVRKPSVTYACTPAADQLLPKPYATVLTMVLDELVERHGREAAASILWRVGERIADDYADRFRALDGAEKVRELVRLFRELGGIAELEECDSGSRIRGYSCPLLAIVAPHPDACLVGHALISRLLGDHTVCQSCQRNGATHCSFEIQHARTNG